MGASFQSRKGDSVIDVFAWGLAGILVLVTVSMQYETMLTVSDRVIPWAQHRFHGRRVIAIAISALMFGHILEIWLFAFAFIAMTHYAGCGEIAGKFAGHFTDFLYFSAVTYTSLGDANARPEGPIRNLVAAESLTGLLMIAWSASFTYLKMEQIWKGRREG